MVPGEVPRGWPPAPGDARGRVLPLFALPRVWLLPRVLLPLHVFEPRYRQMVEDVLDGPGRIVIGTIEEGRESEMLAAPPVYPVAGVGEIQRHQRLPDGRFDVWLLGLERVRVREVESDRLYRKVEAESVLEIPPSAEREAELRPRVLTALHARAPGLPALDDVPLVHLTDLLLVRLGLPTPLVQQVFAEPAVDERARLVLAEHDRRP